MKTAKKSKIKNRKPEIQRLRVLLVDDHAMLLDVLKRQFDADPAFEIVATANSLASLVNATDEQPIDVILLDIEIGGESGLDAISHIRLTNPGIRIIILSMFDHEIYRDRAFELGADAFVTKGARFEALRALLLETGPAVAEEAGSCLIWRRPRRVQSARLTLTGRELQILQALATGQREKDVAQDLEISISSVGTYLKRAMLKIGVRTRAELFRHAVALGTETDLMADDI